MKTFFQYGLIVASLIVFNACSDDSSSSGPGEESSSSSGVVLNLPEAVAVSPVKIQSLTANVVSDGKGGEELSLTGALNLDNYFTVEGYEDDAIFFNIDSLSFVIAHIDNGIAYETDLKVETQGLTLPADRVNLNKQTILPISLNSLETCGKYRIYVDAYVSPDLSDLPEGVDVKKIPNYSPTRDSVDFEKSCKIEEVSSSSGEEICTELEKQSVTLSNVLGTDVSEFNFGTGLPENYQIKLESTKEMATLVAAEGVEIWEDESQSFGILPEEPVCAESFSKIFGSKTASMDLMQNMWLIIVTPTGEYPAMVGKVTQTGAKASVELTYYKAK